MGDEGVDDVLALTVFAQNFAQDLQPSCELTAGDSVGLVCFIERAPRVAKFCTEPGSGVLKLELLDALTACVPEMKTDEYVVEDPVDEGLDQRSKSLEAAEVLHTNPDRYVSLIVSMLLGTHRDSVARQSQLR